MMSSQLWFTGLIGIKEELGPESYLLGGTVSSQHWFDYHTVRSRDMP